MIKQEKVKILRICKDIRQELVKKYQYNLLRGYCYNSSIVLQLALEKENITVDLIGGQIKGSLHYWLEYKGNIIDLTACQFNYKGYNFPKILIKAKSRMKCFIKEEFIN